MKTIGSYEAKTHLSALLDKVAQGEEITITKRGVPVALLVPIQVPAKKSVQELLDEMTEITKDSRLDGLSIRELIDEGRR